MQTGKKREGEVEVKVEKIWNMIYLGVLLQPYPYP
jgi:hypothetical protein